MKNVRIKTKLMIGFVLLAAVVLLVSALSLRSLGRSNERFTGYLAGVGLRERLATDIRGAATRRAIAARNLVLVGAGPDRDMEKAAVMQAHDDVKTSLERLRAAVQGAADATDRDRALFAELEKVETAYQPVALDIVGTALDGRRDAAIAKMNAECRPLLAALLKAANDFIAYDQQQAKDRVEMAEAAYGRDVAMLAAVCTLAVLGAVVMGWLMSRAVTAPLTRAVALAEAVADGDLRSDIVVDRTDEAGLLLAALKKMNENLVAMVTRVRQSADGIATASREIAVGNQDLSNRTEEQASALQQTAASMHQMTSTVQQSAESSRQASELAEGAAAVAGRGGEVVARVVATMGAISESSKKIGDIVGVIDGIAFQTNLLALNAAVEAARAGEQGRGFAVVAGEVRVLAQRSAQAAREIKALIGDSVGKVEAGGALVAEAGTTMGEIVAQVRRVTDLVGDINASTGEQSNGIGQVNQAVSAIDQTTQQNAALVEESAAAAASLQHQAARLLDMVAAFRTNEAAAQPT